MEIRLVIFFKDGYWYVANTLALQVACYATREGMLKDLAARGAKQQTGNVGGAEFWMIERPR